MTPPRPTTPFPTAGQGWELLSPDVAIRCGDCRYILPVECDAVIADPPYSAGTHEEHDSAEQGHIGEGKDGMHRRPLGYRPWGPLDVAAITSVMPERGWVCILSDHTLAREWERSLDFRGRYVFAPVPCVVRGRSVRLSGDGPCSWTDWLVCSRTATESRWGTLPGVYEGSPRDIVHKGGKPVNMMCQIVRDYSRPGDCVLDFAMGSATTGIACIRTGRRFLGIEIDHAYYASAKARLTRELDKAGSTSSSAQTRKDD